MLHLTDHSVLSDCEKCSDADPVRILQKLVHVQHHQVTFIRHCVLIAIETVYGDGLAINGSADFMGNRQVIFPNASLNRVAFSRGS